MTRFIFWDSEKAVSAVEQFVKEQGRLPVAKEMKQENNLPSRRTFESKVGTTFYEYGKRYHPELVKLSQTRHRQHVANSMRERSEWTKETLMAAVKHFVEQHNRLPDIQDYTPKNDLPSYTTFCKIAEIALTDHLKEYFCDYTNQTTATTEEIYDAPKPVYAIWAKARPDSPLAGQSGFLCENRKPLFFPSQEEAELRIRDIRNLCLNNRPAADLKCVEYPKKYASQNHIHLEILKDMDMIPDFDPNRFEIKSKIYGNTGGQCMVGTVQFYLPDLDKSVWVNCNDEIVIITSADYVWNEDQSESWNRYEDVTLQTVLLQQEVLEEDEPWLPMIKEALAYTIEQETAYFRGYAFSLPVAWLPDAIRREADPEYLAWLQAEEKEIRITEGGCIEMDANYPYSSSNTPCEMEL